jgi:hypothetical protein
MRWWYREKNMQPKLRSITGKAGDLKGVPFGGFEWRPNCCHPRGSHRRVPGDGADGQREGGGGILIPRYMAHTTNQKQARHSDKATGRRGRGGEGTGKWPWRESRGKAGGETATSSCATDPEGDQLPAGVPRPCAGERGQRQCREGEKG